MDAALWEELSRRFLRSAEILLLDGDPDGAASRAYYAMFHAAEALLLSKGHEFSKHRAVHSAFARDFVNTGLVPVALHRALLDSYEDRLVADYDLTFRVSKEDAQRHVDSARELIAVVAAFLKSA